MELVISLIHVLSCILIIGVILIQSGKGGGLGAGFGGASSAAQQIFGGRGAGNFLTRSTVALAVTFMATSITLAYLSSRPRSLLDLSETSGAVSSDEDTIIEQGSGELVVIGAEGAADAQPKEEFDPSQFQLQQQPDGEMKLDLQMPTSPDEEAGAVEPEPAVEVEEAPAAEPEAAPAAEEPAEEPAAAKPAPKPKAKPKAEKPKAEKPAAEEKPAAPAEEAPAAEEKPAAPAEEAPAEEAPAEAAPEAAE